MRGGHGAWLGMVEADQCSLWVTDGYDWHKPRWDNVEMIRWDLALGADHDTLLLSDILWKGELIGYEHTSRLMQQLSSVYNEQQ